MYTKNDSLKKSDELGKKNGSMWKQTPLSDFSSKCIMNKHAMCQDPKCKCICHQKTDDRTCEE